MSSIVILQYFPILTSEIKYVKDNVTHLLSSANLISIIFTVFQNCFLILLKNICRSSVFSENFTR